MKWKIPLFRIYWDDADVAAVDEIIKRGMYWATGPEVEKFENRISGYIGTKYALTFNSGTSALHALLIAYGIKAGDEIIVPSFTFISTANAPLFVGAKPVFGDIEERTYGLDPEDVKEKITDKTKAIMPIHYAGSPCMIRELKEIAEDNNLILIEDAAEAFGAKINKENIGSFGDSAMLSFCANKVITTGEGGAIVTDSQNLYEKLKLIRSHGRVENKDYFSSSEFMDYTTLGYNFRMSNILAALGMAQINKIDKLIQMRRKNADYLTKKLSKIEGIIMPKAPADYFHVYQMYSIRVTLGVKQRDKLMDYLAKEGVMTKVYFHPVHLTKFYRERFGYTGAKLPVTEKISSEILSLPMSPQMTKCEIDFMVETMEKFI